MRRIVDVPAFTVTVDLVHNEGGEISEDDAKSIDVHMGVRAVASILGNKRGFTQRQISEALVEIGQLAEQELEQGKDKS